MKITTECPNIQSFCQAVDKALGDAEFTYLSVKDRQLLIYSQCSMGTVSYSTAVECSEDISAGVFTKNFVDTFKRMYGETVDLDFQESALVIKKDNIKVSLPIVSEIAPFHTSRNKVLDCDSSTIAEHLVKSVEVLEKTGYVGAKNPCVFIDNSRDCGTYICRFSDWAFRIAKVDKLKIDIGFLCVPDNLVKVLKQFKGKVFSFIYSKNKFGCTFENNVTVFLSQVDANIPVSEIFAFGIDQDLNSSVPLLEFNRNELFTAVDTVSSILGDTEGFIEFEPIGRNSDGLIWEVKGKTSIGLKASEKVVGGFVEGSEIQGFGISKKVLGKVLKNSSSDQVFLGDLNGSLLGVFLDNQVVYLMSKIHRG